MPAAIRFVIGLPATAMEWFGFAGAILLLVALIMLAVGITLSVLEKQSRLGGDLMGGGAGLAIVAIGVILLGVALFDTGSHRSSAVRGLIFAVVTLGVVEIARKLGKRWLK